MSTKKIETEVIDNNQKSSSRAKTVAAGAVAIGAAGAGVGVAAAMYNDGAFGSVSNDSSAATDTADVTEEITTDQNFEDMSFAEAFSTARGEGLETFEWNGKLYNTKLAEEVEPQQVVNENNIADNTEETITEVEPSNNVVAVNDEEVIIPEDQIVEPEDIDYTDVAFSDPVGFEGNVAIAYNDDGREDLLIDVNNDGYADITVTNSLAENPEDMDIHMINNDTAYIGTDDSLYDETIYVTDEWIPEEYTDYNDTDDIIADAY